MATPSVTPHHSYFISGGGEMGELVRAKDWSKTVLGDPKDWPQSLHLTVSIILSSKMPMFLWWGEDLIQFYNDAYRPSLGNDGKHPVALGQKGKECWPEIWDVIFPLIQQVRNTQEATWSENQLIPIYRNGKIEDVYWTFSYSPVIGDANRVEGVLVICTETTEKVQTRKTLEASEERFRTMADNIPNLAFMTDADGWIFWYNKKWYEYTGTTQEQMEGWGWQSVHDPEELPEVLLKWNSSIANGQPFEMVFPLKGADGKFRQFLTRILPIRNNEDKIYQWFGTNTDITERIEAEQSLKESEQRFRTMAESADMLIKISDETGNATYFNTAWRDLTGKPMEDLLHLGWMNLIHEEDRQDIIERNLYAFEKSEPWSGQFRMLNRDGEYRWLLVKRSARFHPNGSFAGYISSGIDVTEHVIANKKTEEAEEKARLAIYSADLGVYEIVYDTSEMITDDRFKEIWGVKASFTREQYLAAIHPDDLPHRAEAHRLSLLSGQLNYQARVIWKDHSVHWVKISGKVLFDHKHHPVKIIGIVQDITASITAEQQIKKSEKNLRQTILQAPVAMCIFKGPHHVVELANERMFELWGKPSESVMHKPIFEGLPEAKDQGFEALLDGVYTTGVSFSAQDVPITLPREGKVENVFVNFLYEAYREADGSISGVLAVAIETTAQVMARKLIESAYERFHSLSEAMPQIVWTAKPDGNLDYFNKQWRDYSGLPHEQSMGAGWASIIFEEDFPELIERWAYSLQTGKLYQMETRMRRADGAYRWFLIRAVAIKENGTIIQWVGTCTDVQDQKRSEQELQNLSYELATVNEELKASNEELGNTNRQLILTNSDLDNFIYTASHDLKAPILNIEGLMNALTDCLPEDIYKDAQVIMLTGLIGSSIERFKKTINQLTDITQLQKENNLEATEIQLNDVLKEVELDLQLFIEKSNATVEIHDSTCISIHFSQKNLRSIIYNLLSNAIKYRSPLRTPVVEISCTHVPGFHIISVSDNGLGIDLAHESKLFAMFGRLHDHVDGSGVGLYIVKKMVENAGGKIEVESTLGVGSTFKVYFKD